MATQSSILARRIPMDKGAGWATVHGVEESDTNEVTWHAHRHTGYKNVGFFLGFLLIRSH